MGWINDDWHRIIYISVLSMLAIHQDCTCMSGSGVLSKQQLRDQEQRHARPKGRGTDEMAQAKDSVSMYMQASEREGRLDG